MLYQILKETSERYPSNIAAVHDNREYSYSELLRLTDQMANSLLELGLKKGDKLAFYLFNSPEIIICYFACFKIGVTVIPVNYRLKENEDHYILDHCKPVILISQKSLYPQIANIMHELPSIKYCYLVDTDEAFADTLPFSELLKPLQNITSPVEISGNTDAVILYTSGTTGKPKGVELAHEQMLAHTLGHCKLVNYQSQDKTLVCLALSNNFAFSHQMLSAIHVGATLVINSAFDAEEVLEKIETSGITMLYMMPVMFHALNKQAARANAPIANRLRLAIVAGDTTPFIVFDEFEQLFGLEICEGIGMTETQIYALNPLLGGKREDLSAYQSPIQKLRYRMIREPDYPQVKLERSQ